MAVVALGPRQRIARDKLATLLWEDKADKQARQSLRQLLLQLRQDVGTSIIKSDNSYVWLEPGTVRVDALEVAAAAEGEDFAALESAAEFAHADFLADVGVQNEAFEEWRRLHEQRFCIASSRVLERFIRAAVERGEGDKAVRAAEKLVSFDPLREDWQCLLIETAARFLGSSEALSRGQAYAAVLDRETGQPPGAEVATLLDAIRQSGSYKPVVPLEAERHAHAVASRAPWTRRHGLRAVLAVTAIGVLAVLAAAFGLQSWAVPEDVSQQQAWRAPGQRAASPVTPLLILPLQALDSGDENAAMLAEIITDELHSMISRVPRLRVISRSTSRRIGASDDLAAVGAEMKIRYVLEGSLRKSGDGVRINMSLVNPETRTSVWSQRFERTAFRRLDIQDEIVGWIARELQVEIPAIESQNTTVDEPADVHAFKGWAASRIAFSNSDMRAFQEMAGHFLAALKLDRDHIPARLGLATYHANVAAQRLVVDPFKHADKAEEILKPLLKDGGAMAQAHFIMGMVQNARGDAKGALQYFQIAVSRNPSAAPAHAHIGGILARTGDPRAGLEHIKYAMRLSPRDPSLAYWHEFACTAEMELGQHVQAVKECEASTRLNPKYLRAWAGLAAAHALQGDRGKASDAVKQLKSMIPGLTDAVVLKRFNKSGARKLRDGLILATAAARPFPCGVPDGTSHPQGIEEAASRTCR